MSSGNIVGAVYRKLHMALNGISLGFRLKHISVGRHKLKYTDIFTKGTLLSLLSSLLLRLPLNYFILHHFIHLLGVTLITYLSIPYMFLVFL